MTDWELDAQNGRERKEAGTSWAERGKSREMVDEALIPKPRKVRVSRKTASDALAARIAGDSPKPYAEEMEINRLKNLG